MAEQLYIGYTRGYKLTEDDAEKINKRRVDAFKARTARRNWGTVIHTGNVVYADEIYPMIVTKVFDFDENENTIVNGQVFLDGNDVLWVTSVHGGTDPGQWSSI